MAAEPISWKLSIRNSSPNPSSRFSSSASIASIRGVARRDAGAACRDDGLHMRLACCIDDRANRRGSSRTICTPGHEVSGARRRVGDRAPLVSFASVRVSLTVRTKQQTTDAGRSGTMVRRGHLARLSAAFGGFKGFG